MGARSGERGALMVGLMAAVAILTILSTVGFQAWEEVARRDKEAEMIFRAQEYARAIRRFQADQGTLPIELDALMKPGTKGQYFLRHLYKDPLVKDGKWGLLHLAPGGGIFDPNAQEGEAGMTGSGDMAAGRPPSPFGAQQNPSGPPEKPPQQGIGGLANSGAFAGQTGEQGLPIAGVRTLCKDTPFRVFRDQDEYDKWLFTFQDQDLLPPIPGQPATPRAGSMPGGQGAQAYPPQTNQNPAQRGGAFGGSKPEGP